MSLNRVPDAVIDRLSANLRAAGIEAAEADIQGIVEKGFLSRLADIERAIERGPIDVVPDYLASWGDEPIQNQQHIVARYHDSPIADAAAQIRARQDSHV